MLYRENTKNGDKLSQLGFGCMRFPRKGSTIDLKRSEEMVLSAIEKGVNYFDTAYIYPGSEATLGKILGGKRKTVNIATKMPLLLVRSFRDCDKYFLKQLDRLQTDYIDYYLMHMLTSYNHFDKIRAIGCLEWAEEQKNTGRIRNIGFSFHGNKESFFKIVDAYNWDFCMIQYNYMDEQFQAGKDGLIHAHNAGLPVFVMEPLRGGKLVNGLPENVLRVFNIANPNMSLAEWGLRWVWNHPQVTLLLSGMSSEEQTTENIRIACEAKANALGQCELSAYNMVVDIMRNNNSIQCTGCGYCAPCPFGVDIPGNYSIYNDASLRGYSIARMNYLVMQGIIPEQPAYASRCKRCGKCESHCPQHLNIIDDMKMVAKKMEPFWFKPAASIGRAFTSYKKSDK